MNRPVRFLGGILAGVLLAGVCGPATSADNAAPIRVGIIIDDMGYNRALGLRALALDGPVSYSFLPDTPHGVELAGRAQARGRQVLLHLPMEGHNHDLAEPVSLTRDLDKAAFTRVLRDHLNAIPGIRGVNNHMGSRLTPLRSRMDWLMEEMAGRSLFFIDSRTTHLTVAPQSAAEYGVAFSQRDVFLDNHRDTEYIRRAFMRFIRRARERGGAIAIAHPYPETLDVLETMLDTLPAHNVELARVSTLLDQGVRREPTRLVEALNR